MTTAPSFNTERFTVTPLTPAKARELTAVLLQDTQLAEKLPWMQDKTADGALKEAFFLELQCEAGTTRAWAVLERARRMFVAAVLARQTLGGVDLEILCNSRFWNQGVADEVADPVAEWLDEHADMRPAIVQ